MLGQTLRGLMPLHWGCLEKTSVTPLAVATPTAGGTDREQTAVKTTQDTFLRNPNSTHTLDWTRLRAPRETNAET